MEINYTVHAANALMDLVSFIEDKNTKGAGLRWLKNFEIFLEGYLSHHAKIKPCHNATFKNLNLKCIYYNNWLIAFSDNEDSILIEAIVLSKRSIAESG
ncbi:MAG: hypothetical protein ABI855_05310, partial [Bacteroidota bacterium]